MSEAHKAFRDAMSISSALYGMLASCFSGEPTRKALDRLSGELKALEQMKAGWDEPVVWEKTVHLSDSLKDLTIKEGARDFAGLFLGGREGSICPSESCYREGTMYGPSTVRIIELYENAGFVKENTFREPDDHVAVEFVFRFLSGHDIGEQMGEPGSDPAQSEADLKAQHDFIKDHLAAWIPLLAERVQSAADTAFYRALASLADELVKADLRLHEEILRK